MKRPIELPRLPDLRSRSPIDETCRALGADHPLAQVERRIAWLRDQVAVSLSIAVAGAILITADRRLGVAIVIASAAAEAGFALVLAAAMSARRDLIHELFLRGTAPRIRAVAAEAHRLHDATHRSKLAEQLERALDEGLRWHEFMPASRPPYGVRNLPRHAPVVRDIAAGLRADTPSTRALVLVERLMRGGYGSAIYDGGGDWLALELARIRYELTASMNHPRQRAF
jgi:hypothetical protein